jgi:hypothetical protein
MSAVLSRESKIVAIGISAFILSAILLELQYALVLGPFFGPVMQIAVLFIGLILALLLPFIMGRKHYHAYLPIGAFIINIVVLALAPNSEVGHRLHYWINKNNLNAIYVLSHEAKVYEISDMRRYHKLLNDKLISNDDKYLDKAALERAFGYVIQKDGLDSEQVAELRDRLDRSSLISMGREQGDFVLTIDGFLDNEYGYAYSKNRTIEVGDYLMPKGLPIIRLINLEDGWYFYYTT